MGPDRTSCRERRDMVGVAGLRPFAPALLDAVFLEGFFFEAFFFDVLALALAGAVFFLREGFFDPAFVVFFLLGRLRAPDFFVAFFLLLAFLAAFFFADLRAAGLGRAAAFFFDTFLLEGCFLVLLTLRFFPEAFLRAPGFREDAGALLAPARFRFLLAAFLAGMFDSRVREKRGIIHRLPQHGSPESAHFGGTGRRSGWLGGHVDGAFDGTCSRRRIGRRKRPIGATKVQRALHAPARRSRESGQAVRRLSG
jgi:hypothetical protein